MNWREPSVMIMAWVNLIPVIGVVFFDWGVAIVLALYWLETLMLGFLNIPKMMMCRGGIRATGVLGVVGIVFNIAFFTVHFGGFSWGHWTALNQMIGVKNIFAYFIGNVLFWIAVISLMISHLFSFWKNFLGREEYLERSTAEQMFMPYRRVVIMHMIVLFGGLLLIGTESPELLLIVLVAIKIALDIWAHVRSHRPKVVT